MYYVNIVHESTGFNSNRTTGCMEFMSQAFIEVKSLKYVEQPMPNIIELYSNTNSLGVSFSPACQS